MNFSQLRWRFSGLYDAVSKAHREGAIPHTGHGFDHDVTVAALALRITQSDDDATQMMTWCAAMLHSVDRFTGRDKPSLVVAETTRLLALLPQADFNTLELEIICQAALRHSELNRDDQHVVQVRLMDADRLANLMPAVVIRAGQHNSKISALDLCYLEGARHPSSRHGAPMSVLDDLRINLEYFDMLRTPAAIAIGRRHRDFLAHFISSVESSYAELGLSGLVLPS